MPVEVRIRIPTVLRGYTGGARTVEGSGDTLADLEAATPVSGASADCGPSSVSATQ